jgi:hypothetical protein
MICPPPEIFERFDVDQVTQDRRAIDHVDISRQFAGRSSPHSGPENGVSVGIFLGQESLWRLGWFLAVRPP